jgi:hypothetical protein
VKEQESEQPWSAAKVTALVILWLARILSSPLEILGHIHFGIRFIGISGGIAAFVMLFLPAFFVHSNPLPLYLLLAAYLARCAVHRVIVLYGWWKNWPLINHTRDPGRPLLTYVFCRLHPTAVFWLESPIALLVGVAMWWVSKPLGCYLIIAAIGLFITRIVDAVYARNQLLDQHDAAVRARLLAEKYRQLQGR